VARWQLLEGQHIENDPGGKERLYVRGNVFDSDNPQLARWPEKFRPAAGEPVTPVGASPTSLMEEARQVHPASVAAAHGLATVESMQLPQLQALAAEEEIDISDCGSKADIVDRIRKHTAR
jgi:hypothetical protein